MEDAGTPINFTGGGHHLVRYWGSKDLSAAGGIQHTRAYETGMQRLMSAASARNQTNFAFNGAAASVNHFVFMIDTQGIQVS